MATKFMIQNIVNGYEFATLAGWDSHHQALRFDSQQEAMEHLKASGLNGQVVPATVAAEGDARAPAPAYDPFGLGCEWAMRSKLSVF